MDYGRYVDSHAEDFVQALVGVCQKPSIAAQNIGMSEMAELLAEKMKAAGIEPQILSTGGHPVVYGCIRGESEKTLLFYDHYDVQPPDPLDEWITPPFAADIRDGKIFARGASDNKGNAMARILAVKSLLETRGHLPVSVKFLIEGEEEIGSPHLRSFCLEHKDLLKSDAGIWESGYRGADGRPGIYSGVKGDVYLELSVKGANQDMHSASATIVPNPAWRLIWALSTLKNEKEEILVDGFYDDIVEPSKEDLALLEPGTPESEKRRLDALGIDRYLLGVTGMDREIRNFFSPTCTVSGIISGYTGQGQKTVLPARAMAKVDFRLVPNQDPEDIEQKVRKHLIAHGFSDIQVNAFTHSAPCFTPSSHPLVRLVRECAEGVYAKAPHVSPWQAGSGPMSVFIKDLGIPMTAFGVGYWDNRNHGPNENVRIEDYLLGIKMSAAVIERFGK